MNFGTATYGSTAIGGAAASPWFVFFPFAVRADGVYEADLEFFGSATFFSVFLQKSAEGIPAQVEMFTRNDLGETPQSQGTFDGLYAQSVIGAARYIKAVVTVGGAGVGFTLRGRAGD